MTEKRRNVGIPLTLWQWCQKFGKKKGNRSAASVVREAIQKMKEEEEKKKE